MEVRGMKTIKQEVDLSVLPEEARKIIYDFYQFMVQRYVHPKFKKEESDDKKKLLNKLLPKSVKRFTPLKRDEIYAR